MRSSTRSCSAGLDATPSGLLARGRHHAAGRTPAGPGALPEASIPGKARSRSPASARALPRAASAGESGTAARHRHLAARLPRRVRERPLVVRGRAVRLRERLRLALAAHAANQLAEAARRLRDAGRGRDAGVHPHQVEVTAGHRILPRVPEEAALHQRVDARRAGGGVLLPIQLNRAVVLLPPPHQLGFPLADRQRPPDREQRRKDDGDERNRDKEGRHGEARLPPPGLLR